MASPSTQPGPVVERGSERVEAPASVRPLPRPETEPRPLKVSGWIPS